jgi:DNA-binding MarR family transcriptional regulator
MTPDSIDRLIDSTWEFGRVMRRMMLGGQHGDTRINPLHIHALFLVAEKPGTTMKEFATGMHVTSPSATSMVNRLVRLKWVKRGHDKVNRKLVRLQLTQEGKRVLREKDAKRRSILRGIFGLLTPSEQRQLAQLHEKLGRKLSSFHQ